MMPGISIEVDGKRIALIDLTGMQVVDVSVHGALDIEPAAVLSAGTEHLKTVLSIGDSASFSYLFKKQVIE